MYLGDIESGNWELTRKIEDWRCRHVSYVDIFTRVNERAAQWLRVVSGFGILSLLKAVARLFDYLII